MKCWVYRVGGTVVFRVPYDPEKNPPQFETLVKLDGVSWVATRYGPEEVLEGEVVA